RTQGPQAACAERAPELGRSLGPPAVPGPAYFSATATCAIARPNPILVRTGSFREIARAAPGPRVNNPAVTPFLLPALLAVSLTAAKPTTDIRFEFEDGRV